MHFPLVMHPLGWVVLGTAGYLVYRAGKKAGKKEPEKSDQEVKKT